MKNKYKIYTDFDGTISLNDVGDMLFQVFGGSDWEKPIIDWTNGHISSKECFIRGCQMMRATEETLGKFSDEQKIDPAFKDFVKHCETNGYPVVVLSDGLDFYIKRILKKHGFENLPILSNKLIFDKEANVHPEFPYFGKGCPNCGNCKGYHISHNRQENEVVVFVGDGLSDRCGIAESDIIFAKDDLEKYCVDENITYHPFENFQDVLDKFIDITNGGQT